MLQGQQLSGIQYFNSIPMFAAGGKDCIPDQDKHLIRFGQWHPKAMLITDSGQTLES